ncbi:hypothetical protein [Streptomyces montanisoli]|uniref:Uncharacterized protein n=1 Tax=Streptomyces montanisoli TaxID=2798581 RepID=A0A940MCS3_9ACTN|nr:hypothetical protein [Streptomyces montanisoli]MBP0458642.1 hypothetical protein [Streptomyces montanisoli]
MVRSRGDDATSLPLPLLPHDLSDDQRRGAVCAYCGLAVSTGSAVDLGVRHDGDGVRIFPRAHRDCASHVAS